jgi:DNA-binding transcriptional LysR family regulator
MELRHLRYFVTVAEELGYRKAAERLHLSAPSLSVQIRDLESELGVRLFDRNSGGVRLSDAGVEFLAEARLTLAHSQHAALVAREAARGLRGQLAVGYVEPLLLGFMPSLLMVFHHRFPGVDITLVEMAFEDQIIALHSGTIQVGFTLWDGAHLPRGQRRMPITHRSARAIMQRNHHLAKSDQVTLAKLAREQLLCLSTHKAFLGLHGELVRRIFAARAMKTGPIKVIAEPEAFRAALEGGLGVSLIAEVGGVSQSRTLVLKPLADIGGDLSVSPVALWRDTAASLATTNFIAVMRKMAQGKRLAE